MNNKLALIGLPFLVASAIAVQHKANAFTDAHDGKEVTVKVGQPFSITLPTNPTTGYSLYLLSDGQEPWRLDSRLYKPSPSPKGTVGVGGHETFKFTATKTGTSLVAIVAARPFELKANLRASQPFTLRVNVK